MSKPLIEKYDLLNALDDIGVDVLEALESGSIEVDAAFYAIEMLLRIKNTVLDMPVYLDVSGWAGIFGQKKPEE